MNFISQTFRGNHAASTEIRTAKNRRAYLPLLLVALMTVTLNACRDDDMLSALQYESNGNTTRGESVNTSGLVVSEDATYGYVYKPDCRIPLVGEGRVINSITKNLVGVLTEENQLEYLLDDVLTNPVTFGGVAEVDLLKPILSVKDVNRVYYDTSGKGIKVGFVYEITDASLLSLDLLNGFWISTYLKGVEQETSLSSGEGTSGLLSVSLLNTNGGKREVQIEATKPFDEVRFGNSGLSVDVLHAMKVYYAYVGENKEKIAAKGREYGQATTAWADGDLTNSNITDYVTVPDLLILSFPASYTVDFGDDIPVDSEVGYKGGNITIADVSLAGVYLQTQDGNGDEVKKQSIVSGIDISALGGGGCTYAMITDKPARKLKIHFPAKISLLGSTWLYYAYSRDPVTVDVSSYFTIGNDVISSNTYTLPPVDCNGGNVEYAFEGTPPGSASITGNKIVNMTVDGDYKIVATYTRNGETSVQKAVITRKTSAIPDDCNIRMINVGNVRGYQAVATMNSGGSLLELFSKTHTADNLVDSNPDNYAECVSALNLIQSKGIVAVTSPQAIPVQNGGKTRVGFVMQTSNTLLSANVLKYFFIRLYNGSEEVYDGLSQTNNTVGVGLLGGDGSRLRYYVETDKAFDRVELWTAGLLNVSLNSFRLYYAFYEPVSCASNTGTSEACMEMITAQKHGADINYAETVNSSAISVIGTIEDLGNVLDNSMDTYATIGGGVSVANKTTIAVKLNEMSAGQPVGAIVRNPAYVAGVDVLNNVSLVAYRQGEAVADNTSSGGVASVEVIGDDGLWMIEVTPQAPYDEVRITFGSLASVIDATYVYGFYTRPDLNNNGIPDCAETPDEQIVVSVTGWDKHVCADAGTQEGQISILLSGVTAGSSYSAKLTCYPYNGVGETIEREVTSTTATDGGAATLTFSLPVGDYSISGLPYNGLHVQVHPLQTTWKKNPVDTDWNNWSNWTNGSPWTCTNVVIPKDASRYPELTVWSQTDEFWGGNYCNFIHFEPGAAVLNTHYLQYEGAYVEMLLQGGSFHNVSAPLHGMVTGDMFVSPDLPAYFTDLNAVSYPEVRHNPVVRQRMWSKAVPYAISSAEGGTWAAEAEWSRTFNAVNQPYESAQGFSMKVGDESDSGTTYRLRFPKDYDQYHYFTLGGVQTEGSVTVNRGDMQGRFVYEQSAYDPQTGAGVVFSYTLQNEGEGSTAFVAGNPFMSYLDIRQLLAVNASTVRAIRTESDNGNVIYTLSNGQLLADGSVVASAAMLSPMQAFYVEAASSQVASLQLKYSQDMFVQPSASAATRTTRGGTMQPGWLGVSVRTSGWQAGCLLLSSRTASDGFRTGEDIPVLVDRERMPQVKVYSVAEGRALDVQQVKNASRIALGFIVAGTQQAEVILEYGDSWKGWTLVDSRLNTRYELDGGRLTLKVADLATGSGRFYLEKTDR
ncbi:hypothetical protein [uncultured Bacteroides sp.]|uniref:hypothetical protein n=1 Tax=uncultured Bacteroides sp. TaxID=162156 RepID=UPI002614C4A0|nr:hypothetical protein [uncultured Bacteroides sp.]